MATGAGRDPSAERGELERLGEVAQRIAVRAQLIFERGTEHTALDPRSA